MKRIHKSNRNGWVKLSLVGVLALASAWASIPIIKHRGDQPDASARIHNDELFAQWHNQVRVINEPSQRIAAYTGLLGKMLWHRFVHAPTVRSAIEYAIEQHRSPADFVRALDQIDAAMKDPQFGYSRDGLNRRVLQRLLETHQRALHGLPPEGDAWTSAPWQTAVRLLDVADFPHVTAFGRMVVAGDAVYVFAMTQRDARDPVLRCASIEYTLQMLRAPLDGGKAMVVNQTRFFTTLNLRSVPVLQTQVVGTNIYALIDIASDRGVFEFPTDGRPVARLDESFDQPVGTLHSFAVLDGRLYVAGRDHVVACDLTSRRVDEKMVLEGGPVFEKVFLVPDAPRGRVIIATKCEFNEPAIWALERGSNKLTKILTANASFRPDRADQSDNTVVFSSGNALFVLNLERDSLDEVTQKPGHWNTGPHLVHDGYLWSAGAFGRIGIKDSQREYFRPISPTRQDLWMGIDVTAGCLVPAQGDTKLVFGTSSGAWALPLRATR